MFWPWANPSALCWSWTQALQWKRREEEVLVEKDPRPKCLNYFKLYKIVESSSCNHFINLCFYHPINPFINLCFGKIAWAGDLKDADGWWKKTKRPNAKNLRDISSICSTCILWYPLCAGRDMRLRLQSHAIHHRASLGIQKKCAAWWPKACKHQSMIWGTGYFLGPFSWCLQDLSQHMFSTRGNAWLGSWSKTWNSRTTMFGLVEHSSYNFEVKLSIWRPGYIYIYIIGL